MAQETAEPCRDMEFEGAPFTVCDINMARDDLRLFLRDENDAVLGHFGTIDSLLAADDERLRFAMNAGMYHEDRRPVGHYVENGREVMRVITSDGPGNFGLLPNGVLCITETSATLHESRGFAANPPTCRDATQSGPMLVIDGALHPRLRRDSTSRYVRNGIGTTTDGQRAVMAISNVPVNFHHFARLFRDALGLPDALYFDGNISRLHAPGLGRSDPGFRMGPVIGVVGPTD